MVSLQLVYAVRRKEENASSCNNGADLTRMLMQLYELLRRADTFEVLLIFSPVDLGLNILNFFFDRGHHPFLI